MNCVSRELQLGVKVPLPVEYKGVKLDCGYRLDLLVEDSLVVELKAVERFLPLHQAQLITYPLSRIHTGLLINFNVQKLKAGLK
jgi:GxxExxY protein